jgi:poly(A)-specific ribonuclease
VVRE